MPSPAGLVVRQGCARTVNSASGISTSCVIDASGQNDGQPRGAAGLRWRSGAADTRRRPMKGRHCLSDARKWAAVKRSRETVPCAAALALSGGRDAVVPQPSLQSRSLFRQRKKPHPFGRGFRDRLGWPLSSGRLRRLKARTDREGCRWHRPADNPPRAARPLSSAALAALPRSACISSSVRLSLSRLPRRSASERSRGGTPFSSSSSLAAGSRRGCCDDDVGRHAQRLDRAARGRVVARRGQAHRTVAAQRHDGLDRPLAEALGADDDGAAMILQRAGDDFARPRPSRR